MATACRPSRAIMLRMRIRIGISTAAACAALLAAPAARADRRSFVRAYEYATQPQGNLEVEVWNDVEVPSQGGTDAAGTVHRFELEYGLTDHWDLSLYHVFTQSPDAGFAFDSWRLETRYRLAEKGEWPVDVMLYFEVERPAAFTEPFETEEKVILARDIGPFGLVANLVAEQKLLHLAEGRMWELDLGARYEVSPHLRIGAEFWGSQQTVLGESRTSYFAGPSISVEVSKIWLQIGAGFGSGPLGLGDPDSSVLVRSVLGFNL